MREQDYQFDRRIGALEDEARAAAKFFEARREKSEEEQKQAFLDHIASQLYVMYDPMIRRAGPDTTPKAWNMHRDADADRCYEEAERLWRARERYRSPTRAFRWCGDCGAKNTAEPGHDSWTCACCKASWFQGPPVSVNTKPAPYFYCPVNKGNCERTDCRGAECCLLTKG